MTDYRCTMIGDLLMELIEDPEVEASEISDAIMDELREIHDHHKAVVEKTAALISYLGG